MTEGLKGDKEFLREMEIESLFASAQDLLGQGVDMNTLLKLAMLQEMMRKADIETNFIAQEQEQNTTG